MYDKIFSSILRRIKPSRIEEDDVEKFTKELLNTSRKITNLDTVICGSLGKFTWIKGDHDIDLFILFPSSMSRKKLETLGLEYGKKIARKMNGKVSIKYAEHPYVKMECMGFNVDIVPCYEISEGSGIISAVDRSPLHLNYVIKNLDKSLRDDVRLLKQFCKGIGVYGSDAKNMGFSGYVCELIILQYKSFENALKKISNWDIQQVLGSANREKFMNQPLIIIDPVDKNRNAAANISSRNMARIIYMSKLFLKTPNKKYFSYSISLLKKSNINELKKRKTRFIALKMKNPNIIEDNLYPQLRKSCSRIESMIKYFDFSVMHSFHSTGKNTYFIFELDVWNLPDKRKIEGPTIFAKANSKNFIEKHKKNHIYIENNTWFSDVKRKYVDIEDFLKYILKRNVNDLTAMGIPSDISKVFSKASIISQNNFWKEILIDENLSSSIKKEYFEKLV